MTDQTDDNLLIVKSADMGVVAQMGLYRGNKDYQLESVVELTPVYRPSASADETTNITNLYARLLVDFVANGYEGFIKFIKSPLLDSDTGMIDQLLLTKLNEIFKYIVVKRNIKIGSVIEDFEDLYNMRHKVKEIDAGLEVFANWLKTQKVLYTEELPAALRLCEINQHIKNYFGDYTLSLFPVLNCADVAMYRDFTYTRKRDFMDEVLSSEKITLTEEREPALYKQLEGYYADKDKFFNIIREMYIYTFSPYDSFLGGLFKFKVYKTIDDTFTIVSCRTY